jgi:hypothetical protein
MFPCTSIGIGVWGIDVHEMERVAVFLPPSQRPPGGPEYIA